jgi:L-ascorbate metabolism protein UlaG (beta-lactamase superfamily)
MSGNQAGVSLRYLGGPTALLELGGLRLLTDPTFDPPGDYPVGNRVLRKTIGALVTPDQVRDRLQLLGLGDHVTI